MAEAPNLVHVEIFGQTYAVRAGADPEYLQRLARHVDEQMREVSRGGATVDTVRIAVLAALNIADEYFRLKSGGAPDRGELDQRLARLSEALDQALSGPQ